MNFSFKTIQGHKIKIFMLHNYNNFTVSHTELTFQLQRIMYSTRIKSLYILLQILTNKMSFMKDFYVSGIPCSQQDHHLVIQSGNSLIFIICVHAEMVIYLDLLLGFLPLLCFLLWLIWVFSQGSLFCLLLDVIMRWFSMNDEG